MPTSETWFADADRYLSNAHHLHGHDDREAMVQLAKAAEHALKGVMTARTGSHRRGHDHIGLGKEVGAPSRFDRTLTYLEQVYGRRYPDDPPISPSDYGTRERDVQDLIAWARKQS